MIQISSERVAAGDYSTVTAASQQLATMVVGATYRLNTTTPSFIMVGADPTASAADGALALGAGETIYIHCVGAAVKVAIIRVSADGHCTLTRVG